MRSAYRAICFVIAFDVMLQAAFMAWAIFGFGKWIDEGGVMNKSVMEDRDNWHFTEEHGFMFHGINGQMVIPLLVLILLIVSFFAKVPRGIAWAGGLVALVVIQVFVLATLGHETPIFGALHGFNALLIFGTAIMAGKRVTAVTAPETHEPVPA